MRLSCKLVMALCFFCFSVNNAKAEDFTFRKTKWGMSVEQVKASEGLDVANDGDNFIGYKTNIIGKDVLIGYYFVENMLVRSRYILAENHTNKNDYISDWGTAISLGHLVYYSTWETNETEIASILSGENYRISCVIEYSSRKLKDIEAKAAEEDAMEVF